MQRWAPLAALVLAAAGLAGCASSGGTPRPFPRPGGWNDPGRPPDPLPSPAGPAGDGYAIAGTALGLRGAPYRLGGEDPSGFDCSGLVAYVYARHGLSLPRVVRDQFDAGRRIDADSLRPGDLLFFVTEGRDVSHVGIFIGGDQFVHAPNSRGVVRIDSLSSDYWGRRYAGARRVAGDTRPN